MVLVLFVLAKATWAVIKETPDGTMFGKDNSYYMSCLFQT